jgi:hypothetical protein
MEDNLLKLPEEIPVKAEMEDNLLKCHPAKAQAKEVKPLKMAGQTHQVQVM